MQHAPTTDQHIALAKKARVISDQRAKFGAPVSRQQIADFEANVSKSTRTLLTRNRNVVQQLALGQISSSELRAEHEGVHAALKSTLEAYSKSWLVKSAVIATTLASTRRARKSSK